MIDRVKVLVNTCKERFKQLDTLTADIEKDLEQKSNLLNAENGKLKKKFHEKLEAYIAGELDGFRESLENLLTAVAGKNDVKNINPYLPELTDNGVFGCRVCIEDMLDAINKKIEELNAFDFNAYNPPLIIDDADEMRCGPERVRIYRGTEEGITVDVEEFKSAAAKYKNYNAANGFPTRSKENELIALILGAQNRLDTMENAIRKQYDEKDFDNYLKERKKRTITAETARVNEVYDDRAESLLFVEDDVLNTRNFQEIYESGLKGKVDAENGSGDFKEFITLGEVSVTVSKEESHKKYFEKSPLLTRFTKDTKINCPYVLDLKRCGNVFIDINESGAYSPVAFNFVHNVILSFLMSFPARRVEFLFMDVDDRGDFSIYAKLKELGGLMGEDIIRDEGPIQENIKGLETRMHRVFDHKVRYNKCENIFEYNKKSITNPESIKVLVILNYPKGFNSDSSERLLKIMDQGNRSGIFTVLVNNNALNVNMPKDDYNKFIEAAKERSNVFSLKNKTLSADIGLENKFVVNQDVKYEDVDSYIEVLQNNADQVLQRSIDFETVFEYIDKQYKSPKAVKSAFDTINIPIGMRGSEFVGFDLSSSGGKSAHALTIGGTGSGKSNLLHTIILSSCYKYSPDEFQIYLVDFKGGVEFKFYEGSGNVKKQLPHIKLTGLTSNPEDGVAILSNVLKELRHREDMFRNQTTEDIVQYNNKVKPSERVPRLLVIIDEVQELFERNEVLGQDAIKIMAELFKKGRAFGINLFWASQNVPKVAGIRDKVLSQIGTRICLKLNNTEDAREIDISVDQVKAMQNKVEKGLAILKESGGDNVELRVAYAASSEVRVKYIDIINKKWKTVTDKWKDREPLFVVGNDKVPNANEGRTKFTEPVTQKSVVSKSNGIYQLNIGQNYISGKAFNIPIDLRGSKQNMWIAGSVVNELRDIMGFAMLSVIMENLTNKDIEVGKENLYYANGEIVSQEDANDLFYVLPEKFKDDMTVVESKQELADLFVKLLKLRRERSDKIQGKYPPVFVFINKLQSFTDLFKDNMRQYDVGDKKEEAAPAGGSLFGGFTLGMGGEKGDKMTFTSIFNEVMGRGSDVGIHVIFSIDTPSSISEIEKEMAACVNKIVLKGVKNDDMLRMMSSSRNSSAIRTEGLGYWYENNDLHKFKPYNYDSSADEKWFAELADKYNGLKK